MNNQTGFIEVNHNNNPDYGNVTHTIYLTALTLGSVHKGRKITLKINYPYDNSAPYFVSQLPEEVTLKVYEDDQINGYSDRTQADENYTYQGYEKSEFEITLPLIRDNDGNRPEAIITS